MNLHQFPEGLRAHVLSAVVRYGRQGIKIVVGDLEGSVLPIRVQQEGKNGFPTHLSAEMLKQRTGEAFSVLPYILKIEVAPGVNPEGLNAGE
jgi:hypothetical protein